MKARTKISSSKILERGLHIFSRGSFFMHRVVLCDENFNPKDFLHIPLNRKIENLMGYSPYIGKIFLARILDYVVMQDNFAILFDNGHEGLLSAKQEAILLLQGGSIKKANKIVSGQYAILQCVKHDLQSDKKPLFSTELRFQIYRHKLIVNKKKSSRVNKKWQQNKIKTPDFLEKMTDKITSLELFHQYHEDENKKLPQELIKIFDNDLKKITQKNNINNIQQDEIIQNEITQAIFELSNRNETKNLEKEKLTNINISPAFIANKVKQTINNLSPCLPDLVKLDHNFFAPFEDEIEQCYEMLGQETIEIEDRLKLHIQSFKAGYIIDIDMIAKPHLSHKSRTQMIFENNKMALGIIMEQLRLRNIGGLIFIDLVNMSAKDKRQKLYTELLKIVKKDHLQSKIAPLSMFQVFEIARQKQGNILLPMKMSAVTIRKLDQALMHYFHLSVQAKTAHFDKTLYLAPSLWKMYCNFKEHIFDILVHFNIESFTIAEAGDWLVEENKDFKIL